jgi:hypothetical protein
MHKKKTHICALLLAQIWGTSFGGRQDLLGVAVGLHVLKDVRDGAIGQVAHICLPLADVGPVRNLIFDA